MRLVSRPVVGAALALAGAPLAAQVSVPAPLAPALQPGEAVISVQAEGVSRDRPNVMEISAGATTTGQTSQAAVRANAALVNRLIEVVRRSGVEARDVQTQQLNVTPRFARDRQEYEQPRILGYVAENSLRIRFRDLSRASEIIEALFASGANTVSGPRFSLNDEKPARRAAERDAIVQARAEADNLAGALGKRVGRLLRVTDRQVYASEGNYGEAVVVTGSRTRTPVEPGEISTSATVTVDFTLVDR